MWNCFRCALEWHDAIAPGVCPRCGAIESYALAVPYQAPRQVSRLPLVDLPRIATGDPEVDALLYGGFAEKTRLLLWGRGGTGKSRLAMRWATGTVNALYISLEMHEEIATVAARTCGANGERLYLEPTYATFQRAARECGARIIVLDSISVVPRNDQTALLSRLTSWAERNRGVVIVICHQNKRGQHVGSSAIQHWGDAEIYLRLAKTGGTIVEVLKSRFCPNGRIKAQLGQPEHEPAEDAADYDA